MRGLRLFVALTAAAAMMISLPAAASAQGGNAYETAVLGDGAVAFWSLADASGLTAADATGNNDANYRNGPTLGATGLVSFDNAVDFDGTDDHIKVPNSTDINTGGPYDGRTIELWFNADVTFRRQVLFEEGGVTRGLSAYLFKNRVYVNAWNIKNDDVSTPWGPVWLSAPIEADTTYHLAMTIDEASGKLKAYINGSQFGQQSGVGKLFAHSARVGIGAMWDDIRYHDLSVTSNGTRNYFDGVLDNVAVYNTALSQSTIQSHTAIGGGTVGTAPSVTLVAPATETVVGGDSVLIQASATDDVDPTGSLTANFRIDGGAWQNMAFNGGSGKYEGTWDATPYSEGSHAIQVRVFDSHMASKAKGHSVIVDNISAYGDTVIADGAVAYWRLNDSSGTTAVDVVGNLDGTYTGGPALNASGLIPSDSDNAVDFDGQDDFVAIPNDTVLNSGGPYTARSVELWFEADDVNSRQVIFEEGGVTRGLATYVDQGDLYVVGWNTKNDDVTTPWGPEWVSVPVFANTAYHLVLTLDGSGDLVGYLNGLDFGTVSNVGNLFKHNAGVGLGAMDDDVRFHDGSVTNPNQDYFFDGTIDDVAVYNSVLSSSTVGAHTVLGGESVAVAPSVDQIEEPSSIETLAGTVDVFVHASDNADPSGSLVVQWRIDGGSWNATTYNGGTSHYEGSWDTTQVSDGSHTLEVRAIDSDSAVGSDSISVDVDNSSAYSAEVLSDNPVAYWRLGESSGSTAIDETGNNDATYVGGPTLGATSVVPNESDTSVDFDGVDDYVNIATSSDINTGGPYNGRTIELWFDADDITTRQVLFEEGGVTRGLSIYLDQGTLYATAWNTANDGPGTPWGPVTVSTTGHSADIWWQVVVVLDEANDALVLYLDGLEVDSDIAVGELFSHSAKVGLGAMNDDVVFFDGAVTNSGLAYFFNGQLDDVSIYNTALTSTQVGDHFTAGAGGLELEKL
ncbi:MAG: hypothetical protein HKN91_14165 [Acidimicrobiia bacterium]|nr:hypothetical protein [Acidimicrobiia bacterium]